MTEAEFTKAALKLGMRPAFGYERTYDALWGGRLHRVALAGEGAMLPVNGHAFPLTLEQALAYLRKAKRAVAASTAQRTGEAFEAFCERHHEVAYELGIVAARIRHNQPQVAMRRGAWTPVGKGDADYTGVLMDGASGTLAVEAKRRCGRLRRAEVSVRQQEHLDAVVRGGGGMALLLAQFVEEDGSTREFRIPWADVPWRTLKSAPSIGPEDVGAWEIPKGESCYLDALCPKRGAPAGAGAAVRTRPTRRYPSE